MLFKRKMGSGANRTRGNGLSGLYGQGVSIMEKLIIESYKKLLQLYPKQRQMGYIDMTQLYGELRNSQRLSLAEFKAVMINFITKHNQKDFVFEKATYARREVEKYAPIIDNRCYYYMRINPYRDITAPSFFARDINNIPITEQNELIDHIVQIAMLLHVSGIQVAEKLEMPNEIMWLLRERSLRAAMASPCPCPECNKKKE